MELEINIGDRVKLNYDVKEFDIVEYIKNDKLFSFKSVQHYIPEFNDSRILQEKNVLTYRLPVVLFNYEEELLKIKLEDGLKIGYTNSFRVDLNQGIEENEILINDRRTIKSEHADKYENFIIDLLETNQSFSLGLITKSERKSYILDYFLQFYRYTFKDALEQIKKEEIIRESKLSEEEFFRESWEKFLPKKDFEETKTIIDGITFVWKFASHKTTWIDEIILNGIQRGIDKKTHIQLGMGALYISKNRIGNNIKCSVFLKISLIREESDKLIYAIYFWDKEKGIKEIETSDIWQNAEFENMMDEVIKGPVY